MFIPFEFFSIYLQFSNFLIFHFKPREVVKVKDEPSRGTGLSTVSGRTFSILFPCVCGVFTMAVKLSSVLQHERTTQSDWFLPTGPAKLLGFLCDGSIQTMQYGGKKSIERF